MDDKIEKLNKIRIDGHMSDEDSAILGDAISMFQFKKIEALYEKYARSPIKENLIEEPTLPPEDSENKTKPSKASVSLFNKTRKTLKFQMMQFNVLEDSDYKCSMCRHQFPTKEKFKKEFKKDVYPLFVRCKFNIPQYIETVRLITLDETLKDNQIFNKDNYQPVCTTCKPSRFAKKKL